MSHGHGKFLKSPIRTREAFPAMNKTKEGAQILCPFCTPTHPLLPGEPASCGTILKLTAVQSIVPSRISRMSGIKCLKCHMGGGEMVQYMNGYVHLNDCTPGTRLLPSMPNFNIIAGLIYKFPMILRQRIEKLTGITQEVREIDQEGKETGRILGHFFLPIQKRQTQVVSNDASG